MEDEKKTFPGPGEESLGLEVTTRCNSACTHCFARAGISGDASLSRNLVKKIVQEGFETGYRHLQITGGEPLLWEGLLEMLEDAYQRGYESVFLNTNGTLLTDEICRALKAYDNLTISVSLQGPEALHDGARGAGSYKQAERGIEKALDAGLGVIIFTSIGKRLLAELPRFVDDLYKQFPDLRRVTLIQIIRVEDDVFDLSEELLDPGDFLKMTRMVSSLNLYGHRIDILNDPLVNVVSKLTGMPWTPRSRPMVREGRLMIMANRDITLAHSSRESYGVYEPGAIRETLASARRREAAAPDNTVCPSCEFAKPCGENGMDRPSSPYMDMRSGEPYCKRVLRKITS
ncbi:MAG: radical SAM protein [Desulfobacterales bacterium]|nr:radical SAM protein [Desulfobacterales bacterium]